MPLSPIIRRLSFVFIFTALLSAALIPLTTLASATEPGSLATLPLPHRSGLQTIGDPLPRIQCPAGYTATIFSQGLASPDGLAFGADDLLYVAEETAGRVSRIAGSGLTTTVVSGLVSPEGIAFDKDGNLFIVEDVDPGRVIKRATNGITETVASGREAPEGIVWVDDGSADGILYITEQNLEQAINMSSTNTSDYRTHVTSVDPASGMVTRILTTNAVFVLTGGFPPTGVDATFWSYSGITYGVDKLLYFANELSGQMITGSITVMGFPLDYVATSGDSVFKLDPAAVSAQAITVTGGLTLPEGLNFVSDSTFPLYVAQEDAGDGMGRVSTVHSGGSTATFCTGFFMIEDVIVGPDGVIYVSEDDSGLIIAISKTETSLWLPTIVKPGR